MKLEYIKDMKCPICGTNIIISESIDTRSGEIHTHCNGERFEHRTFICGQEISYIPNYNSVELSKINICTNNDEYKTKVIRRHNAKNDLIIAIENLNVDENYKTQLKHNIKWM